MTKISTGHAKQLVYNYDREEIGKGAQGVWFSRRALLEALDTDVQGVTPNGLRFYFAKYENYQGSGHVTRVPKYPDESEMVTLVIVPTTHRLGSDGRVVMHPWRLKEILPFDLLEEPDQPRKYDPIDDKLSILIEENDGQICPPPPPPA